MRIGLLKRWLKGLPELEAAIAAERGPFALFALLEIEDWNSWNQHEHYPVGHCWRLYVAAPWIWDEEHAAEKFLRERTHPYEDPPGFRVPSLRVEVVKPTSPYLEEVWDYCSTEDGMVEVHNVDILDVTARRGYIFAARRPDNFDEIQRDALLEIERLRERQSQRHKEHLAQLRAGLREQGTA